MSLEDNVSAAPVAAQESMSRDDLAKGFLAELQAEKAPEKKAEPEAKEAEPVEDAAVEPEVEAPAEVAEESEAEEADDTATAEPDDAAETPSDDAAIAAPSGMSDADKTQFAKLPSEMKAWLSKQASAATADYTRKSQFVAEQKKQFDTGIETIQSRLQTLDKYLASFTDNDIAPPNFALRNTDPVAYDDQLAVYMHKTHQRELATKERQKIQAESEEIEKAKQAQFERERFVALREIAPEFFGEKGVVIGKQIRDYAAKSGYSPEQLQKAGATDLVILWKAARFDAIEAAKKQVKPVSGAAPKTVKPAPAKAIGRPSQVASAMKSFEANPSRATLADVYLAEIRSERR